MTENNPWRKLPEPAQKNLADPLYDAQRFEWDKKHFQKWFKQFYGANSVDPKSVYPEWRFNHGLTPDERNALLCLYAKLSQQGLWDQIGGIRWVGNAAMTFNPAQSESTLLDVLKDKGYTEACVAKGWQDRWGLRSSKFGAELHFRGEKDLLVNVHLDLHNPGSECAAGDAVRHFLQDDRKRATTHTPVTVRNALERQGITVLRADPEQSRFQSK